MERISALTCLVALGAVCQAATFDAYDGFTSSNPNGPWSFGYQTTLNGTFNLFEQYGTPITNLNQWTTTGIDSLSVSQNTSASANNFGTISIPGETLDMHPGPNGQFAVIRFTAPSDGLFQVDLGFFGCDFAGPTTTDVHLAHNGIDVWSSTVTTFGTTPSTSYMGGINLLAGDTLDAIVGFGNGSYAYDSTGVVYAVEGVPEPTSLVTLTLAATALMRRRRAK